MDEFSPTTDHWNYDFTFHSPWSPQQTTSTPIAKQLQSATIILYMNDNYGMIVHILVMWTLGIQIQISHLTFFWIPYV